MQLKNALCYALLTITWACIYAENRIENSDERLPQKVFGKRIATLVIDDATPVARVFQQPKVIYRRLSKKSYTPPRPTYGPRRTKYGPPRTLKKPGKKYRGKNGSKHAPFPYPYKKRAPNPRYGPPKRGTMKPVYGAPKKNHRIYSGIGFGEPPMSYMYNKHRSPKPTEFTLALKPKPHESSKPHDEDDLDNTDFSTTANVNDNFANKPGNDVLWPQQQYESANSHLGYGEPPVDSYGAPVRPNLHDLTFSTMQSYLEATSHLDEDRNFGPDSRPWNNFKDEPDNNFAYSKKRPIINDSEETEEVFVTPVPEKQNHELYLNSYSDIYNYRQEEKAKLDKKKRKTYLQKNIKMLNHPWLGAKMKEDSKDEVIVGGQYAEPPARYMGNYGDHKGFSAFVNDQNDIAAPISSYVNYKNSNMAFSPQNLNDAFSIVDK